MARKAGPRLSKQPELLAVLARAEEVGRQQSEQRHEQRAGQDLHLAVARLPEGAHGLDRAHQREQEDPQEQRHADHPELGQHLQVHVVRHLGGVDDEVRAGQRAGLQQVVDRGVREVARPDAAHRLGLHHPPAHGPHVGPAGAALEGGHPLARLGGDERIEVDQRASHRCEQEGDGGPAPAATHGHHGHPRGRQRHQPAARQGQEHAVHAQGGDRDRGRPDQRCCRAPPRPAPPPAPPR